METRQNKFNLGTVYTTRGVAALMREEQEKAINEGRDPMDYYELNEIISRHRSGDWGDLDDEDKASNDNSLIMGYRLLSKYKFLGKDVYIITEHDRSVTTILFPDEY